MTYLPAAHADVFAVFDSGNAVWALSDVATGVCATVQKDGWKNAYFVSYGRIPSCWARDGNRITICPAQKGQKFRVAGCSVFSASQFVARDSLPRPAFPK
jgi:hypothetical protein